MYVIANNTDGPVKLGISHDPHSRTKQLQTGHVDKLEVFHQEPVDKSKIKIFERLLHRDNRHYRIRGEWFNMSVKDAICYIQYTIIRYDLLSIDELQRLFK